jgi:hemoglobin
VVLYDELGGAAGISTALGEFYPKVLADPTLSPFFHGVDLDDLARRVGSFMAMAAGGPAEYQGPTLREVHQGMALSDEIFDRFVGTFEGVLVELGAGAEQISQVMTLLNGARGEVLNR